MDILEPKYLFTLILLGTIIGITIFARRSTTTAANFYVGGRTFGWFMNGSAIAGDLLSAATFLGLAGLTFTFGYDGVFYTFCFSAGLAILVVFVAGPLRRFGAFTIPDFFQQRFGSKRARLIAVIVLLAISGFYAAPQLLGAALILKLFYGTSYSFGVWAITLIMIFYVAVGGMKGTTFNQALELWMRFGCFIVMFVIAMAAGLHYGKIMEVLSSFNGTIIGSAEAGKAIVHNGPKWEMLGGFLFKSLPSTLSILIGIMFGTSGLPHILLRFYTNPSAKEARYSGLCCLAISSIFFILALYLGAAGRYVFINGGLAPGVVKNFATGGTNMVIPALAEVLGGQWLLGFVIAGAFAAIFSNLSGLFIATTGALAHDIYAQLIKPNIKDRERVISAKIATVVCGIIYAIVGLMVEKASIGHLVGLAFCVAASTFSPVIILGIWWRGITERGAISGMIVGMLVSMYFILLPQFVPEFMRFPIPGLWTVPLGFLVVYAVSKFDGRVPKDVNALMVKIHSKEESI